MRGACRVLTTVLLALAAPALRAQPGPARSPRNASYTLDVRLDAVNHLVYGTGRLVWRNTSANPAAELRFHLYWNAWRSPASTWLREAALGRNAALSSRPSTDAGYIDLTALTRTEDGATRDLLQGAHFIAPDDGNADDRTVLAVPLDRPVGPNDSVAIDFSWNAHVPRPFARTGVIGHYFFLAQWFPKIGVLEDDGWNCHEFHAATEFFADYGTYDVRLRVPTGWTVGATGTEQSRTDNHDGTTTHRYTEADVHDFAWTTSPDFVETHARFEDPDLPPVDLRLLLQPEHRDQADRHLDAVRATLRLYGQWFGPYPYAHLTIVDPPTIAEPDVQGDDTGGMEYPTLITTGTHWVEPWKGWDVPDVTIHETGHQFWYGVVGTNEVEHAWLDEGLDTYATARAIDAAYPDRFRYVARYFGGLVPWMYEDVHWSRDVYGNRLDGFRRLGEWDAGSRPTWQDWPGTANATTYARTALWMTTLERMAGWDAVRRSLALFFARGAFHHPTPDDFIAAMSEGTGRDLTAFFDVMYRSRAQFDYAVEQVTARPLDNGSTDTTVVVRRLGDGVFPVDVRVAFDDGSTVTETWDGRDGWKALRYRRGAAVTSVEVDPDRVLALDRNVTNNSWYAHPLAAAAAAKWSWRWLTWFEHVLLTYASLV